MAIQNAYNNYIKRQKTQPINNFKEKVANSLNGKSLNNTNIKQVGYGAMTNNGTPTPINSTSRIGTDSTPKIVSSTNANQNIITTPVNEGNNVVQAPTSDSNALTKARAIDVPQAPQNVLNQPVPTENTGISTASAEGLGMMSLAEVNEAISPKARTVSIPSTEGKTHQQIAQDILNQQKEQMQKDWEIKKQELELQKNQLQNSYNQSVTDADSKYNETTNILNNQRYQQMQDLAVSGQNRGIQYSPQQLGLENVANINHNKNLAEASKSRNELLNKLQIELNNSMANITLGLQNATNEYNKALGTLMSDYQKQMMNWTYDEKMTEEERKWQEQQTLKDQEFQKMMQELSQQWQAEQNALDRAQGRSGGGYSGYSGGYSRSGYSGYSRNRSGWDDNWTNYGGYDNDIDLTDNISALAYEKTFKEASTDTYNALDDILTPYSPMARADVYRENIDDEIKLAMEDGASEETLKNIVRTRDHAIKQLFENHSGALNYGNDFIKRGDDMVDYYSKNLSKYDADSYTSKMVKKSMDMMRKSPKTIKSDVKPASTNREETKNKVAQNLKKSQSNVSKNVKKASENVKDNVKKASTNTSKNVKKASANASKNIKKATTNAKTNVKKASANANKNVKKSSSNFKKNVQKAVSNLTKNVKKAFKKKK